MGTLFNQPVTHGTSESVNTGLLNRPRYVEDYLQNLWALPNVRNRDNPNAVQLAAQLNRMTALWH